MGSNSAAGQPEASAKKKNEADDSEYNVHHMELTSRVCINSLDMKKFDHWCNLADLLRYILVS